MRISIWLKSKGWKNIPITADLTSNKFIDMLRNHSAMIKVEHNQNTRYYAMHEEDRKTLEERGKKPALIFNEPGFRVMLKRYLGEEEKKALRMIGDVFGGAEVEEIGEIKWTM